MSVPGVFGRSIQIRIVTSVSVSTDEEKRKAYRYRDGIHPKWGLRRVSTRFANALSNRESLDRAKRRCPKRSNHISDFHGA
jgi:hypothetical protein